MKTLTRNCVLIFIAILAGVVFQSCSGKKASDQKDKDKFSVLIEYIESSGDFINSEEAPAAVDAGEVADQMKENIHIIDIRAAEDFTAGHISGSVNVPFAELITYFETKIDAPSFKKIYLFSSDGQAAFFASGLLRLLGYNNVFPVRYGLCAWDKGIAEQYWLKHLSSKYSDKLTTENFRKANPGSFPEIISDKENGYDFLRERATELLQKPYKTYVADIDEVMKDPSRYYIVCYWKEEYYNTGHLPGAVHYTPKQSLSQKTMLNTLPADKPVLIYCNSGNHSSTVAAYLRILGYDAFSLYYGANSFMYDVMKEKTGHYFDESQIYNFSLEKSQCSDETTTKEIKKTVPQGGC